MNKKKTGLILGILTLMIAALAGFGLWKFGGPENLINAFSPTSTAEAGSEYQTTSVRRGDLSISISGSGTVVTLESDDLSFATSGTLTELDVAVGDLVAEGQVLARLGDTEELELEVENQELAVKQAQKKLDDLLSNSDLTLAQAYTDMAAAETALAEAQANLHQKGDSRCAPSKTQDLYFDWLYAQKNVDEWEGYLNDPDTGYGRDYILEKLAPMRKDRDQAYSNYTWCQGYTEQEILNSEAALGVAKATLEKAKQVYQDLQDNAGQDPIEVELAQASLDNAERQLEEARANLEEATLRATMDGTVMEINGEVGDAVSTGTFITLADLEHPIVQVNVDETDLTNFAVGCPVNVTFDSLSGENFPGVVTEISPSLVTVQSVAMVEGLVDLEKEKSASGKLLPLGLQAVVEVTCQESDSVLYIPAQAVYDDDSSANYVYVLNAQGQPEKRAVKVGIKTAASAEIQDGLSEGEKVILSQIEKQ